MKRRREELLIMIGQYCGVFSGLHLFAALLSCCSVTGNWKTVQASAPKLKANNDRTAFLAAADTKWKCQVTFIPAVLNISLSFTSHIFFYWKCSAVHLANSVLTHIILKETLSVCRRKKKDAADHLSPFENLLLAAQPVAGEGEGAASGLTLQTAARKARK